MLNHGCLKIIIKMLEIYNKIIFHRWSREQLKIKKNKDVLTQTAVLSQTAFILKLQAE